MAVKITPKESAALWAERLGGATARITLGVERVTEAPGAKAAAAQEKMLLKITEAINSGRWAAEVSRVTLPEWKKAMLEKGVPRIRSGATAAIPEMEAFCTALFSHIESEQAKLEALPSVTLANNVARMVQFVEGMADFTWKGRAR